MSPKPESSSDSLMRPFIKVRRYRLGFWRFACHFGRTSHVMKLRAIRVENNLDKTRKADEN
jgi:hypothetical protein